MGAYLSKPITEKELTFEENDCMAVVSCSMQGWRTSQEDAHNAILDYGVNSSMFAVYDGHGGSEVAKYCALHLPEFIKENAIYKSGDFEKGLVESFVSFDKSLTSSVVVDELKKLSGDLNDDDEDQDEHDPGEVNHLYEEATMPIEHVIAKYQGELLPRKEVTDNGEPLPGPSSSGASTSRPPNRAVANLAKREKIAISPSLRGKTVSKVADNSKINGKPVNSSEEPSEGSSSAGPSSSIPKSLDEPAKEEVKPETSIDPNATPKSPNANGVSPIKNGESETTKTNGIHEDKTNGAGSPKKEPESKSFLEKIGAQVKEGSPSSKKRSTSAIELYHKVALADPDEDDEDLDDDSDQSFGRSDGEDSNESDEEDQDEDDVTEEEEEDDTEDEEDDDDDDDGDDIYETTMAGKLNEIPGNDSGCTAVVAVLSGNNLYVANAGDSRCIVSRNGKAVDMSEDHKPEDPAERARIEKAGGSVTLDGRVNGGLNLSRALGDHAYKKTLALPHTEQMISPVPDIRHLKIDPETDSFVFLACDGIWNSMSSQEVVDFISKRFNNEESSSKEMLESICKELFEHCLAPDTMGDGTGCDNMTAVLVKLKPGYKAICSEAVSTAGVKRAADEANDVNQERRPIKKSKPEDENVSAEASALKE